MNHSINRKTQIVYHGIIYENERLSNKINTIAFNMKKKEFNKEKRVLIFLDRTPELICSLLAAWNLGITYVPVSTYIPQKRLEFIIEDSEVELVITNFKYKHLFKSIDCICVEELYPIEGKVQYSDINRADSAYILYTSGTTGVPKGVEVSYEAVFNLMEGINSEISFSERDTILFLTDISFDIAFVETIFAALRGMTILLADEEEQRNPRKIVKLIQERHATILQMTPSRMKMLKEIDNTLACLSKVNTIMLAGEVFPRTLLETMKESTMSRIYNLYGPTETTIFATIADLTDSTYVNIGKPVLDTEVYIINEKNEPVADGVVGEIAITGRGLSKGYINDPILTKKKFVFPSFTDGQCLYKTGDLGRYNSEGFLEYIGRSDNQIKLNGYRIELEEIENVLYESQMLEDAVTIFDRDQIIVIYKANDEIQLENLKEYMKERLPFYMQPSIWYKTEEFSYSVNGKIDKKETYRRVNELFISNEVNDKEIERTVIDIVMGVLPLQKTIDRKNGFDELGMNSISWIKVLVEIEKRFNFTFEDDMLMNGAFQNVDSLVKYVEMNRKV